jgi:hypothetical protein
MPDTDARDAYLRRLDRRANDHLRRQHEEKPMPEMTPEDLAHFRRAWQLRDRCAQAIVERMAYLGRPRDTVSAHIAYIADTGTDGFIPSAYARMYGTPEWIARLVEVGLWAVEEKGFRDTRYLELNATKEEKDKRKMAAAARQRNYQHRKSKAATSKDTDASVTHKSRVSNASGDASPYPSPLRGDRGGRGSAGHPFADDGTGICSVCNLIPAHRNHIRVVDGRAS